MTLDNNVQLTRRKALAATGATAVGGFLTGCLGGAGSGGGGDQSFHAQVPEAHLELGTMPHLTAVREIMPEATDGQMTGEVRRFETVRLILTAMNAGSVDVYTNAPANMYFAQVAGNDYKLVGNKVVGTDYYIVGHEDEAPTLASFVERPDELTFAINQKGNIDHLQIVGVYDAEGLDFNKATTVNVGGSSSRIQSFLSGQTQGFTCHVDQLERLRSDNEPVKALARVADYFPQFVQECLAVPTQSLEDPAFEAWVQEWVNAVFQANMRASTDFDWIFQKAQKYQAQPLDRQEARGAWEVLVETMNAWRYEEFSQDPYDAVATMLTESGQLDSAPDIDGMFEPKYAETAIDNLDL